MRTMFTMIMSVSLIVISGSAVRAEMFIYPSKGQSKQQESEDKWQCHQWAVQQTGVDPLKLAEQATNPDTYRQPEGGFGHALFGGGAHGAALGAVGGAITGDAGKGAARGAAVGGLLALFKARRRMKAQHQYNESLVQGQRAALGKYEKAYATCLRGRGYTVSQ